MASGIEKIMSFTAAAALAAGADAVVTGAEKDLLTNGTLHQPLIGKRYISHIGHRPIESSDTGDVAAVIVLVAAYLLFNRISRR